MIRHSDGSVKLFLCNYSFFAKVPAAILVSLNHELPLRYTKGVEENILPENGRIS